MKKKYIYILYNYVMCSVCWYIVFSLLLCFVFVLFLTADYILSVFHVSRRRFSLHCECQHVGTVHQQNWWLQNGECRVMALNNILVGFIFEIFFLVLFFLYKIIRYNLVFCCEIAPNLFADFILLIIIILFFFLFFVAVGKLSWPTGT